MAKKRTPAGSIQTSREIALPADMLPSRQLRGNESSVKTLLDRVGAGYKIALLWDKANGDLFLGFDINGGHKFTVDMDIPEGPDRGKAALDIINNHPFAHAAAVGHVATETLFARRQVQEAA